MKILDKEKNLEKTPHKFNVFFNVLTNQNMLNYIT